MKKLSFLALILIMASLGHSYALASDSSSSFKRKSCSRSETEIVFKHEEDYRDSCDAITRAEGFFHTYGHEVDAPITIVFQEKVTEELSDGKVIRVYGKYKVESNTLFITSSKSDLYSNTERKEYGVKLSSEMLREQYHLSRVTQHISHFYTQDNIEENGIEKLNIALRKFVAYVVQITTMDTELKQKILKANPGIQFDSEKSINPIIHNDDPQKFGIMSHRFFHSDRGGNKFLKRIFEGDVKVKEQEKK